MTMCAQMCYDSSGGGRLLRKFTSINLAPWHNFKHGVELIWKTFALDFFAPMYHALYPGTKFYCKLQSPQEPTMMMLCVAKAYPSVKARVEAVLTKEGLPHTLTRPCSRTCNSCASSPYQW